MKVSLQHKWQVKCSANSCEYESIYKPPAPFEWRNEAVISVTSAPHNRGTNLGKILSEEVASIRSSTDVIDYLDEDGRHPTKNVATWKELLNGREVGFIKYRVGNKRAPFPHTFTAIHGIVLGTDRDYYVHLLSFYAGHYDQVTQDQIAILKALAASASHPARPGSSNQ